MAMKLQQLVSLNFTPPERVAREVAGVKPARRGRIESIDKGIEYNFGHLRLLVGHFDGLGLEVLRISKG
jgi:hypothetical protein